MDTEDKQSPSWEPEAMIHSVLGQEILQLDLKMLRTAAIIAWHSALLLGTKLSRVLQQGISAFAGV